MNNCESLSEDLMGVKCLEFIDLAIVSMDETMELRQKNKLSKHKFSSIKKELSELKKVLKCYIDFE